MRVHWMRLAVTVIVLSLAAGCAAAPPPTQPPAPQSPTTEPPATQPPTAAPSPAPSATPPADILAVVQAFEEAYNRHDVDATEALFGETTCMDWGAGLTCGPRLEDLLRYDAALNSQLEMSDCIAERDRVTCEAEQVNDCLTAGGLGATHYAPVSFSFQDGSIATIVLTKAPEDAQRDLLFLYSLGGWAHRTRPTEWDQAGQDYLLSDALSPTFNGRTGAVMSGLCKEYAAVVAAAATPNPSPPPAQAASATGAPGSVLFIGDSASVGLDDLLPVLAASGQPSMTVASQLNWRPGVPLAGHYELGDALDEIGQGQWDVVVLQDDLNMDWPGRAAEFFQYGRKLDQAIKQAGAETVFYMVYPYKDAKETTTQEIAAAYSKIGQDLGAKVAPVALAFQRSIRERPELDLYRSDGVHPNEMGVYLIGCVLYTTIFGRSPIGLAYGMPGKRTGDRQHSEEDAAFLQRVAWETVQEYQAGR